jgi:hypothetical protein
MTAAFVQATKHHPVTALLCRYKQPNNWQRVYCVPNLVKMSPARWYEPNGPWEPPWAVTSTSRDPHKNAGAPALSGATAAAPHDAEPAAAAFYRLSGVGEAFFRSLPRSDLRRYPILRSCAKLFAAPRCCGGGVAGVRPFRPHTSIFGGRSWARQACSGAIAAPLIRRTPLSAC